MNTRRQKQSMNLGLKVLLILLAVVAVLAVAGIVFVRYTFQITEVTIEGSKHYTYEELYERLFENRNDKNVLLYKYSDRKAEPVSIPFIAKVDTEIVFPGKMHFTVYEKSIVGYVMYMGTYMYFDKDGVIVECSTKQLEDIPYISGLNFSNIVIYTPLDVKNPAVFSEIQNLKQYLEKYKIDVDEIIVSDDDTFSIRVDDVMVLLGNQDASFSEKVYELSCLQFKLVGLKGTLNMQNYTADSKFITFTYAPEMKPESGSSNPEDEGEEGESETPQEITIDLNEGAIDNGF